MTDSENSLPQDDSDEDIYKDFAEFNFEDELAKLEGSKESYKQEALDLTERVKKLTEENEELKKSSEVLKKNLSTLLKTAQAEVQRKDLVISELRTKVESFTFRRNNKLTKDKFTSTEDLEIVTVVKSECNCTKKITSKFFENRTSSDSEHKSLKDEEKKKESSAKRDENLGCDNRKLSYCRDKAKSNSRHPDDNIETWNERYRGSQSYRYREKDHSDFRKSFRYSHRDHLKYDPLDKKRHSDERRFLSRLRDSRERRTERREESPDRRRRRDLRKNRSRSREKELSDKVKVRASLDKDSVIRIKEQPNSKQVDSESDKPRGKSEESRKRIENPEKQTSQSTNEKLKKGSKEKNDRRSNLHAFDTRSPLDALYSEPPAARDFARPFSTGNARQDTSLEEGEFVESESLTSQPKEDWALSFKNERPVNATKPMTLYSKRMMQKFSKEAERLKTDEERTTTEKKPEASPEKRLEDEKEPGELTDDENIVESSKEFQELTKVASIERQESSKIEIRLFKEPSRMGLRDRNGKPKENLPGGGGKSNEDVPSKEDLVCSMEAGRPIGDVIEFSPFKNNYKLIEISPVKPSGQTGSENVLELYNKMLTSSAQTQKEVETSILNLLSSFTNPEKPGLNSSEGSTTKISDSLEEKDDEAKNKSSSSTNSKSSSDGETLKKNEENNVKNTENSLDPPKKQNREEKKPEEGKPRKRTESSDGSSGREKQRPGVKKEKEMSKDKGKKRKRGDSECEEKQTKKPKQDKVGTPRKKTRSKKDSKSEPELQQEESEEKVKEDISFFEFFKPITATKEKPKEETSTVCASADYKMTAMSLTGVVCLETPNKRMEKLKNLMINEQMIYHVLDPKPAPFSPLTASKCPEMTPRRMLKNDLMLTDSEDDSRREEEQEEEEEEELQDEVSDTGDSDSGASDFVDLL